MNKNTCNGLKELRTVLKTLVTVSHPSCFGPMWIFLVNFEVAFLEFDLPEIRQDYAN